MSRYLLMAKDDERVFVGWDNPLQTFFIQKYNNYDLENEELEINIGTNYEEIPGPHQFIELLENLNYKVDDYLSYMLFDDFKSRTELTPLQKRMHDMFSKMS